MQLPFLTSAARRPVSTGGHAPLLRKALRTLGSLWTQIFTVLQLLIALLGVFRYGSPGAVAYLFLCTYFTALTWMVYLTRRRAANGDARLLMYTVWIGGSIGSLSFVLITPHFLTVSLLMIVSTVVHVISLPNIDAPTVRNVGVTTFGVAVLLLLFTEWSIRAGPLFDLQLFQYGSLDFKNFLTSRDIAIQEQKVAVTIESIFHGVWIVSIVGNILHLMWDFHHRILNNVSALRRTNREHATAQRALEQRLHERTQLLEVTRAIASTQDFASLLRSALVQLKTVVDYGRATVLLLNDEHLEEISSVGHLPSISPHGLTQRLQEAFRLDAITAMREPMIFPDPGVHGLDGSHLFVPLVARGKYIGLLTIRHATAGFYTSHHADLCMAYANQVAGIIAAAQLQKAAAGALVVAERNRLARELHDSVSQSLFGIVLGTRTALQQVDESPDAARTALLYSVDLAAAALAEMRALIFTMRPETLEQRGLVVALRQQIDLLQPQQRNDIEITVDTDREPDTSIEVKEALYRIAVEAMQNAIRHARCSRLQIALSQTDEAIMLHVRDDGQGFDPQQTYSGHLGLKTMHERAAAVGGALHIDSGARGTCVSVRLPTPARA